MIVKHADSEGLFWYFRVDESLTMVERVGHRLDAITKNVVEAKTIHNPDLIARGRVQEAIVIADLQAYHKANEDAFLAAPAYDRYVTASASKWI